MYSEKSKAVPLILFLMLLVVINLSVTLASQETNYFLIEYGDSQCPHCVAQHKFFLSNYGSDHYVFCDIRTNQTCMLFFAKYLKATGLPASVPQTLVFVNGHLNAIVIGEVEDKSFWDHLISVRPSYTVSLYLGEEARTSVNLTRKELIIFIDELIPKPYSTKLLQELNKTVITNTISILNTTATTSTPLSENTTHNEQGLSKVIPALVPLALADSINPCTFTLYVAILFAASVMGGKKGILASGTSFIIAVYLGYMSLGVILSYGASLLPKSVMVIFAGIYGVFIIAYSILKQKEEQDACRVGKPGCKRLALFNRLGRKGGMISSLIMGFLASYTLLPCSGGPYVAFAAMTSLIPVWERVILLAIYDAIFVLPLALILAGIAGSLKVRDVERALVKYEQPLLIASGIILIAVSLYLCLNI